MVGMQCEQDTKKETFKIECKCSVTTGEIALMKLTNHVYPWPGNPPLGKLSCDTGKKIYQEILGIKIFFYLF